MILKSFYCRPGFRLASVLLPVFGLALTLAACGGVSGELRKQTAHRIAMPAFMVERWIPAGLFQLNAWERMHARGKAATVYIEGDGVPWGLRTGQGIAPTLIPTPKDPVALHLASRDMAENVVYLARPCQYLGTDKIGECPRTYWEDGRFAPEVIDAYMLALDEIKARYDITGFHFVGYDGGANVAALVAGARGDALSLRTVAGNLNPDLMAVMHETPPLTEALNATTIAPSLADLPQYHFIGAADDVTPPAVYHSYRQAMGPSPCTHYSLIQDADHTRGWVEKWPQLLQIPLECAVVHKLPPLPPLEKSYDKGFVKK